VTPPCRSSTKETLVGGCPAASVATMTIAIGRMFSSRAADSARTGQVAS
jgi:hypothetical protein